MQGADEADVSSNPKECAGKTVFTLRNVPEYDASIALEQKHNRVCTLAADEMTYEAVETIVPDNFNCLTVEVRHTSMTLPA